MDLNNGKKILLVEDNEDDIELTKRAFRKINLANEIITVTDGEEALDFFECKGKFIDRDPNEKPALVLLDLNLPKIDGLDVLREIRRDRYNKYTPVVILTSSQEEKDLIRGYDLGANSYIRKPIDFLQFIEAVRTLGLYWIILNNTPELKG